jgi:hypothetical protein
MKQLLLLIISAFFFPVLLFAQRVELTPFGGYVFAGRMDASNGYIRFKDNAQYGGMLSIAVSRVMDIDLIYNRSDTKAEVNVYDYPYEEVPLSINYMQLGFTKNFRVNPTVSPFVGFNLGACLMAPKEKYMDAWFFSMGMDAGAKIYFSKRVGLRLQAQAYIPIEASGFTFFVGTGGAGGGVSVYSSLVQFGFTGGLIFRLGHITH